MAVKMEGPLTKWTNVVQGWQYRWFVLDELTGLLSYYTSKDRMMRGARRGCLRLKGGKIGINDEDDSTFTITCDHRTFHFQARDSKERTQWVKCLEETIVKHSADDSIDYNDSFKITGDELNRKMQEAEAYFRLLTQQVKKLESQMNHGTKSERSLILKDSLTQMIETMGQTIELLHNAKSSLAKKVPVPVIDGPAAISSQRNSTDITPQQNVTNNEFDNGVDSSLSSSRSTTSPDTGTSSNPSDNINSSEAVEIGSEVTENENGSIGESSNVSNINTDKLGEYAVIGDKGGVTMASPNLNFAPMETVPITTYTSSDDEDVDEFFDANEQFNEITVDEIESSLKLEEEEELRTKEDISGKGIIDLNVVLKAEGEQQSGGGHAAGNTNKDVDEKSRTLETTTQSSDSNEYEDENEDADDEAADLSSHGSVITHLLSQVKIGMDLTKVTLPTFILERRSLLEMYADFFAHPDLFKGIPDFTDPSERMIQVLRWYLSSFHAGRKSTVAKKPYNPILGETFQCFFDLTEDPTLRNNPENLSKEGPIPWGTKEDVTFVAEQVSHHPPISAFYAECENKRICFNSHIWTKSKFLGLSIGVHMAGSGSVFVSDYDEEYIMTFPNAYCRSILTVPWVELGGKTEITCPATGFNVQIDLLTKPFYGGKKNRITADVYAPSQKKPFLSVNGEWNGVMYAKRANSSETEVFVDTFNMPIVTKKVKLRSQQEEFESRKMWRDVTVALKTNDIEGASAGKNKLEEKQRQDARVRKETGTKWVTRLFDEEELSEEERIFHYKWPLYKRQGLAKPGAGASQPT